MKHTAERLFGDDVIWSTLAAGKAQIGMVTQAALLGGHMRVGLEDSLLINRGQLAVGNAEQVSKIRRILDELGLEVAPPDEARQMLSLKGGGNINF